MSRGAARSRRPPTRPRSARTTAASTLVDLRTGAATGRSAPCDGKRARASRSAGRPVLATGSDDGSVAIWDVPTRRLRERFAGHAAAARRPALQPRRRDPLLGVERRERDRLGRPRRAAARAAVPFRAGRGRAARAPAAGGERCDGGRRQPGRLLFATSPGPGRMTLWRARDQAVLGELRGPCGAGSRSCSATTGACSRRPATRRSPSSGTSPRARSSAPPVPASEGARASTSPADELVATAGVDSGRSASRIYELAPAG